MGNYIVLCECSKPNSNYDFNSRTSQTITPQVNNEDQAFFLDYINQYKFKQFYPETSNEIPFIEKYELITINDIDTLQIINKKNKKKMRMKRITSFVDESEIYNIKNKIQIIFQIEHPNIKRISEMYIDNKNSFYEISENSSEMTLEASIKQLKNLSELYTAIIFYQILKALSHCHYMGIYHGNINQNNIIISNQYKNGYSQIKLTNFSYKNKYNYMAYKDQYTETELNYISPEVLINNEYVSESDIWSTGVLLYYILVGKYPFDERENLANRLMLKDMNINNLKNYSEELIDLLEKLLDKSKMSRITADMALEHEWFKINKVKEKLTSIDVIKLREYFENMLSFKILNALQLKTLYYLLTYLSDKTDEENANILYYILNTNNESGINKYEFIEKMTCLIEENNIEFDVKDLSTIFNNLDYNYNNSIELSLFVIACVSRLKLLEEKNILTAFLCFADEKNDIVNYNEIIQRIVDNDKSLKNDFINVIKNVDPSNSGEISFDKFKDLMCRIAYGT